MELQRGVCSLCLENSKVFTPSDAEDFSKFLPKILYENFLSESEFQKIKDSIKVCGICCYKIEVARETRKAIQNAEKNETTEDHGIVCRFCKNDKYIVKIRDDWKYFVLRSEGFLKLTDFPVCVCPRCLFYFDTIFNMKTKLTYKFPQLAANSSKSSSKQNDTPKRKSISKSPPSSKKRKIFNNCFTYLQPLCNNSYYVDDKLKSDSRLYKKIAYVDLTDVKNVNVKETPKVRPVIKIKLKPRSKKGEKEKITSKALNDYLLESSFKTRPYVKLCKSEETASKTESQRGKKRRHSVHEETPNKELREENIEETPKAASDAVLVPKRRVSLLPEPSDVDNEEKSDNVDTQNNTEENKVVDKYIEDSTFNDNNKLDLLEEIGENNVDSTNIEENGIEKSGHESHEEEGEEEEDGEEEEEDTEGTEQTEEKSEPPPDECPQEENLQEDQKNVDRDGSESPVASNVSSKKTTPSSSSSSSSDGSDSDTSDKQKSQDNPDGDSINGSERKKKRVTFSDEIN